MFPIDYLITMARQIHTQTKASILSHAASVSEYVLSVAQRVNRWVTDTFTETRTSTQNMLHRLLPDDPLTAWLLAAESTEPVEPSHARAGT